MGLHTGIQSIWFKPYQIVWEGKLMMEARWRLKMEKGVGNQRSCHLSKFAQWVSGEGQTKSRCCTVQHPTVLGSPLLNSLATLPSFLVLLINADLFKFLTNFLLFLNGARSHLHVKFQRSLYPKDVARKCLIHANYLAEMQQNYEVKNTWGLERVHMWDMSQDKNKLFGRYLLEGESQDYADSRNHKPARPKILGRTENSGNWFDIVSMVSIF